MLIRPHGAGFIGATLKFDYEIRSSQEAFDDLPEMKVKGEMLELAKHIINTKKGSFDARAFDDRYEAAVAELVKAKIEGRALPKKKAPAPSKPSNLLQALRDSAGMAAAQGSERPPAEVDVRRRKPKRTPRSNRAA